MEEVNPVNKWDARFLEKAKLISGWSKDPHNHIGAVIAINNIGISEGYNGPPQGVEDTKLEREIEIMRTIHAEMNAIIFAARPLKGATIYVYPYLPCANCAAGIIQAGIKRVIYHSDRLLPNWKWSQKCAKQLFKEAGVEVFRIENLN